MRMTAQIRDKFYYRKKSLLLAATNGSGLFDPTQHGITPGPNSTNCWRGYYSTYEVEGRALLLTEAHLALGKKDEAAAARGKGPLLFGKVPRRYTKYGWSQNVHTGKVTTSWESSYFKIDGIREPVPFMGGRLGVYDAGVTRAIARRDCRD
jgi:hypothetical protein